MFWEKMGNKLPMGSGMPSTAAEMWKFNRKFPRVGKLKGGFTQANPEMKFIF